MSPAEPALYIPLAAEAGKEDTGKVPPTRLQKLFPILRWLPTYKHDYMIGDISGGVTLGTMGLAQTMAHAAIATTLPIQGPYCALSCPIVYAFMGTSLHGQVSSGAMAAMIIANVLQGFPDIEDRTELASVLALISGFFQILMGAFNLAFAVRFLSQPTLSGFVSGGALVIIASQLRNFFGYVEFPHCSGAIEKVWVSLSMWREANVANAGLCAFLLIFLDCAKRLKICSKGKSSMIWRAAYQIGQMKEIVAVIVGLVFVHLTLDENGDAIVPIVGEIPQGLPPFKVPWRMPAVERLLSGPSDKIKEFVISGALIAFSSFLTSYSSFKKQALANGYELDASQELFALGSAGVVGSFFGAFPPSGSLSRTGLAVQLGVKTQAASILAAGVVGLGLVFLAPMLQFLPKATLSAIVINSARGLIDYKMPSDLWNSSPEAFGVTFRKDLLVWFVGFLCTILFGALYGIAISVFVAVGEIVADAAAPKAVSLGAVSSLGGQWRDVEQWDEAETIPGILVFEFRGPLCFASAEWFQEEIERMRHDYNARSSQVRVVILALGAVPNIDYSALSVLKELLQEWKKQHVQCMVADAKSSVRHLLKEKLAAGANPLLDQFNEERSSPHHEEDGCISVTEAVTLALSRIEENKEHGDSSKDHALLAKMREDAYMGSPVHGKSNRNFGNAGAKS